MFLLLVTLTSMLLAAIMSGVAWRLSVDERRRSEARVAALAAEIHGVAEPMLRMAARRPADDLELRPAEATRSGSDLFASARPAGSRSRLVAVMAIGVFVFGSAAALSIVMSPGSRTAANPSTRENQANPASPTSPPLELVALGHERDGDRLTVRGVVRNPGPRMDGLTAVVFLFSRDGGFLASGRATIESGPLGRGGESTFVVTVPGANLVGRYRVSFRTENRVVPHVDRRHES